MYYKNFYTLFREALAESDEKRFIAKWGMSCIFYPESDQPDPDATEVASTLKNIWQVAHMKVADIRGAAGLTQASFAQYFCIPRRTVENWEMREGTCTDYYRLMMAESLGILKVKRTL
jgi:DNA-binding XRE family transcriptional regulator